MKATTQTDPKIIDLVHRQIGDSFSSMIQYFADASRFDEDQLPEINGFFTKIAERKKDYALRLMDFTTGHGSSITIPVIPAARTDFGSVEELVQYALKLETAQAGQFKTLSELAQRQKDSSASDFIEELVSEQAEEVKLMQELLGAVQSAGNDLLLVEDFLIKRTSVAVEL